MFITVLTLKQHTDTNELRWVPVSTLMDLVEARRLMDHLKDDHGWDAVMLHHEEVGDLEHICGPELWESLDLPTDDEMVANCLEEEKDRNVMQ